MVNSSNMAALFFSDPLSCPFGDPFSFVNGDPLSVVLSDPFTTVFGDPFSFVFGGSFSFGVPFDGIFRYCYLFFVVIPRRE